ncbi:MAG: T9SS type A sorting domain-containing protein [Ignavibacteria bacterium]|jgi:hypothetical protein|nr:T9SS type A sorting domain-containing protein [Ignavibacteria bacterium]
MVNTEFYRTYPDCIAYLLITDIGEVSEESPEFLGIKESTISNIILSPNPTDGTTTLSLYLETQGNLNIVLTDLLGNNLFELHNEFTQGGAFAKTFSLNALPAGTYFIKINHNGNAKIEKIFKK